MSGFRKMISCATVKPGSPADENMDRTPDVSVASLELSRLDEWTSEQLGAYMESTLKIPGVGQKVTENHLSGADMVDIVGQGDHEMLKEIGILAVGHRMQIVRAFRDYSNGNNRSGSESLSQAERKTQEKTQQDIVLDRRAYGPLWESNFPGVSLSESVPDQRFFEFFARTRIDFEHQREIWVQCVGEKHICTFDEFVVMMKMTCYVQLGVPPKVISVGALHTNHPSNTVELDSHRGPSRLTTIPTSAAVAAGSSSVTQLTTTQAQSSYSGRTPSPAPREPVAAPNPGVSDNVMVQIQAQASHNVMFQNLPQEVLDSDDYLYSLESLALHVFNPIHFEIDGNTLIATFDNDITARTLSQIRDKTVQALISMGIETRKVQQVQLSIPPMPNATDVAVYENTYVTPGGPDSGGPPNGYGGGSDVPPPPPPPGQRGGGGGSGSYDADPSHFYNEFMRKVNLQQEFATIRDGKLRTMNVMNILAKLRGVGSSKDVKFNDVAIKELSNLNRQRLDMYLRNITPGQIDILMGNNGATGPTGMGMGGSASTGRLVGNPGNGGMPGPSGAPQHAGSQGQLRKKDDDREQFIGVVISGLPESITENDDSLLQLDAIVLNDVTVEHIEVVGTTLRITFGEMIAKTTLTNMRKSLRDFLFDNGLQKKEVKNVTIAPHTYKTWKGRITDDTGAAPIAFGQPQQPNAYHPSSLAQQPYQKPYGF